MHKQMIFGPGIKAISLDQFFKHLKAVEGSGSTQEVYAAVSWLFRCVNIRANAIASLPWEVKRGKTVTAWTIPLRDLLWKTEAALLLSGAAYWLKIPKSGELKRLEWVNPTTTRAIISENRIDHFEQNVGSQKKEYSVEEIVYFRSWNPGDDFGPGIAPGRVALEAAGLARNANQWAESFFAHGAIPAVVLTSPGRIDEPEEKRVREAWDGLMGGVRKFKTAVFGEDMKVNVIGSPVKDVGMPELMEQVRQQIAVAFGVPEDILTTTAANYATAIAHDKGFHTRVVIPESFLLEEVMNEQLFSKLPRPLVFAFTPESLEIMQEEERDRSEALLRFVQAGMPLQAAVQILGIDIPEGMDIKPTAIPQQVPTPQVRQWKQDLKLWEKKALRHLSETKSAACEFDSETIPDGLKSALDRVLATCKTAEEVKASFELLSNEGQAVHVPGAYWIVEGTNMMIDSKGHAWAVIEL